MTSWDYIYNHYVKFSVERGVFRVDARDFDYFVDFFFYYVGVLGAIYSISIGCYSLVRLTITSTLFVGFVAGSLNIWLLTSQNAIRKSRNVEITRLMEEHEERIEMIIEIYDLGVTASSGVDKIFFNQANKICELSYRLRRKQNLVLIVATLINLISIIILGQSFNSLHIKVNNDEDYLNVAVFGYYALMFLKCTYSLVILMLRYCINGKFDIRTKNQIIYSAENRLWNNKGEDVFEETPMIAMVKEPDYTNIDNNLLTILNGRIVARGDVAIEDDGLSREEYINTTYGDEATDSHPSPFIVTTTPSLQRHLLHYSDIHDSHALPDISWKNFSKILMHPNQGDSRKILLAYAKQCLKLPPTSSFKDLTHKQKTYVFAAGLVWTEKDMFKNLTDTERKQFADRAVPLLMQGVELRNSFAAACLCNYYLVGYTNPLIEYNAVTYFQLAKYASDYSVVIGMLCTGWAYMNALGTAQDSKEAIKQLTLASDCGCNRATAILAENYEYGLKGFPKNKSLALKYYRRKLAFDKKDWRAESRVDKLSCTYHWFKKCRKCFVKCLKCATCCLPKFDISRFEIDSEYL
jgi:hypothetical protein